MSNVPTLRCCVCCILLLIGCTPLRKGLIKSTFQGRKETGFISTEFFIIFLMLHFNVPAGERILMWHEQSISKIGM